MAVGISRNGGLGTSALVQLSSAPESKASRVMYWIHDHPDWDVNNPMGDNPPIKPGAHRRVILLEQRIIDCMRTTAWLIIIVGVLVLMTAEYESLGVFLGIWGVVVHVLCYWVQHRFDVSTHNN